MSKLNDGSHEFNAMQRVKRRFFAMRNGALAKQMADYGGAKYQINFGLNLPQISEIARDFLPAGAEIADLKNDFSQTDFARKLRENRSTRESMLIAPMLFPVEKLTFEEAITWARSVPTPEVADILCLKLLRNFGGATDIIATLLEGERTPLIEYTALRLTINLLQSSKLTATNAQIFLEMASPELAITANLRRQLSEEIEFLC